MKTEHTCLVCHRKAAVRINYPSKECPSFFCNEHFDGFAERFENLKYIRDQAKDNVLLGGR
jgi:hypothetical protein